MLKYCLYILTISALFLTGCEKDDPTDPNYPTIIEESSTEKINQIIRDLSETPFYNCTSIDTFGFCFISSSVKPCKLNDSVSVELSKAEIISIFDQTVVAYKGLLNIPDPASVIANSIFTLNGFSFDGFKELYPDSTPAVIIISSDIQFYEGLPVIGTEISVIVAAGEVVSIGGKRFNTIYIPTTDVYSEDSAKVSLYNQTFTHSSSKIKLTENTYWYNSRKIILPITRYKNIELLVCWALYPENWEIIIDSQTGEVISSKNIDKI